MALKPPDGATLPTSSRVDVLFEAPINVQYPEYGALGDGVADDTAEIQAAVTAGAGGTVFFPEGTYLVTTAITVPSDTRILGDGWGSVLKVGGPAATTSSINGFTSTSTSRVIIENLRITGPTDGTMTTVNGVDFGKGIFFDTVTDYVIRNVHLSRFNIQGIYVGTGVRGRITGNTVTGIYSGNGISIDGSGSVDNVIEGNTLKDIADDGIGTHNSALRTVIANNTITNTNFGRGVDIYGAVDSLVIGNTLRDIGGSGTSGHGILVYLGLTGVPDRTVIHGNHIHSATNDGIQVLADSAIAYVQITGNMIYLAGGVGVRLARSVQHTTIVGNVIISSTSHGISFEESGATVPAGAAIAGNTIRSNGGWGIVGTASVTGVAVGVNRIESNTSGRISLPATTNTYLFESAAGYLETNSGLTVRDFYASQGMHMTDGGGLGYLQGVEQSADPAAPAANAGRLFFKDNGAGKTQLAVRFASGATQVIATEP